MITREDVWRMDNTALAAQLARGHAIDLAALRGPYRGVALGLGGLVERLTWKTFRKRFWLDEATGDVVGHNERLVQTGVDGEIREQRDRSGAVVSFGPYLVTSLPAGGTPFGMSAGRLLDYGARHPSWHPLARVRDPLVALNEGSVTLLLGGTYLAIGGGVKTPSFFTLEKEPLAR
jgi:hypothetical protein